MKFHDELNPVLWTEEELIPEVKEKLMEIADAFIEFLEIPEDSILDKVITGSSASYNYNEFSDLDLHIIVDYDKVHEDCPLVNGYLNSLKKQFNDNHDITIHGVPVELYAEQKDQGTVHNGLYSLQTGWIDKPQKIEPTDNDAAVEAKFNEIKELVDKCDDSEEAIELLDKIYTMRKAGLAESGEFCTENLAFKKLRNEGCMDKLRQIKKEQIDKQLSLESYNEAEDLPRGMKTKINKAYKDLKEATKEIIRWCDTRGWYGPRLTHAYSTPTTKVCYLWHGKFNSGFCDCIVTINWSTGDIIYNIETGSEAEVEKKETLQTKDLQEFIAWFKEVFDYEYQNVWDGKNESIKESLQSEYKQAFDLLVEGENIVGTLDTDFGKQFVKDVENLYKLKSYKLKLSVAKEMLRDIQGYLIDEQYDDYNNRIEKFMNNSKNESIKESENIIAKINKLIDNVNKTILDTIKNKKEAKLYTLKQNKNKDGQTVLKLYRGNTEFMTSKLAGDTLLSDDIIGHLNSIKSNKYESIKEEVLPHNLPKLNKLIDRLNNSGYWKVNGDQIRVDHGFGTVSEQMDLTDLANEFRKIGFKVYVSHFSIEVKGLKDYMNKDESIKENIKENKMKNLDRALFQVGKEIAGEEIKLNPDAVLARVCELMGLPYDAADEIAWVGEAFLIWKSLLDKPNAPQYMRGLIGRESFYQYCLDKYKRQYEQAMGMDEDLATLEKKMDNAEKDLQDMISKLKDTTNEQLITNLDTVIKKALDEEVEIDSHKFTFRVVEDTVLLKSDWFESAIDDLDENIDKEELKSEIEEQLDFECSEFFEGEGEITGTEIVGFKYNTETKEGEFEFNIFFEE